MLSIVVIVLIAFVVCVGLMPPLRRVCTAVNLVDAPDGRRKIHGGVIPLAGGPCMFLALAVALMSLDFWFGPRLSTGLGISFGWLLVAGGVICVVGLLDDAGKLRGRHKLVGQLIAIGVVVGSGVEVHQIQVFGWTAELGILSVPFVVFFLLAAVNSLNLLDGMDGLLGTVGLVIAVSMACVALLVGNVPAACAAAALAGVLLGFLCYNLPPATTFMGDSGSMLVGLFVGVLALGASLKTPATIGLAMPLALLALPAFDSGAAIVRRKLTGRSIYTTDRGHLHHCLLRSGLTPRRVLALVGTLTTIAAAGGVASQVYRNDLFALIAGAAVVGILVITRSFGHAEYLLIRKRLSALVSGSVGRGTGVGSRGLEIRLQGHLGWTDVWALVVARAHELGLTGARLDVNAPAYHENYHARWGSADGGDEYQRYWRLGFPLSIGFHHVGELELSGEPGNPVLSEGVAALVGLASEVQTAVEILLQQEETTSPRFQVPSQETCPHLELGALNLELPK